MKLFRRHRGSQGGNLSPVVSISPPGTKTARQVITAAFARVPVLAHQSDYVQNLVDDLLLDLQDAGLAIVASSEVE